MPHEEPQLDGRRIVLTGGVGGIGSLLARDLMDEGADLLVVDRAAARPARGRHLPGDLSTMEGIGDIATRIAAWTPDMLINLAGVQYFGPVERQDGADLHATCMVNLVAPMLLTQAVLPAMKKRGSGHIVNIGSVFGSIAFPHFATYSSTKAGLRGFSEALRRELHGTGIDVTYVAPRAVRTGLNSGAVMRFAAATRMAMDDPETVAALIVQGIVRRQREVFIGRRERLFVFLNALAPRLVDAGLAAQTERARQLFVP